MTAVDDLIAWLRVQLDEDERWAREASAYGDVWDEDTSGVLSQDMRNIAEARWRFVPHIARWDPARVLAEVEAKRIQLALIEVLRVSIPTPVGYPTAARAMKIEVEAAEEKAAEAMMRLLALPYADRPGYREEWRPLPS